MAHKEQLEFVRLVSDCLPIFYRGSRVIEVGSLDINGTVRQFFTDCDYTGLDVAPGPCVDVVCQGQDYDGVSESFDTVISCEAMEHNPYWMETFKNMVRLCKSGGLVLITCATTGRREHGTTRSEMEFSPNTVNLGWEYYRNLRPGDFEAIFDFDKMFIQHRFFTNWLSFDLYFCGIARGVGVDPPKTEGWDTFVKRIDDWLTPYNSPRRSKYRKIVARLLGDRSFVWQRRMLRRLNDLLGRSIEVLRRVQDVLG